MTTKLRTGFTTGTCAAAAAKAAVLQLRDGDPPSTVEIPLPSGIRVTFNVEIDAQGRPYIEKDAGDDPDCTNGAHLTATAKWTTNDAVTILGGDGVGLVTKPGLGLTIGEPAINPVPRRMITAAVREVTAVGVAVTISVPGGQEMASHTTNDRLGILGGISILGTTGIVKPFSTASYRASIVQQINVAHAQGVTHIVLATGSRTEQTAINTYPAYDRVAFVEVGDFTGVALKKAAGVESKAISWFAMIGKVGKVAQGTLMTHFHRSHLDTALLVEAALTTGAPPAVVSAATETTTARHFYEVCQLHNAMEPLHYLVERAAQVCHQTVEQRCSIEVCLVDFDSLDTIYRARRGEWQ
ncbi:MAG: cobalt-precorrin-5B (C(1))-methyltransferase [Ferrimicrobium sp.]